MTGVRPLIRGENAQEDIAVQTLIDVLCRLPQERRLLVIQAAYAAARDTLPQRSTLDGIPRLMAETTP